MLYVCTVYVATLTRKTGCFVAWNHHAAVILTAFPSCYVNVTYIHAHVECIGFVDHTRNFLYFFLYLRNIILNSIRTKVVITDTVIQSNAVGVIHRTVFVCHLEHFM